EHAQIRADHAGTVFNCAGYIVGNLNLFDHPRCSYACACLHNYSYRCWSCSLRESRDKFATPEPITKFRRLRSMFRVRAYRLIDSIRIGAGFSVSVPWGLAVICSWWNLQDTIRLRSKLM